jgi:hypothetical protein
MPTPEHLDVTLLCGSRELLALHARELPQRDDLCGAFCAALAMRAGGVQDCEGEALDQDAVALAAGSIVSRDPDGGSLPRGETGRRDYRLELPMIDDSAVSGTTAAGLVRAIEELSQGRLAAIPYRGPWSAGALGGLFGLTAALERPVALVANVATRHLWGAGARVDELLGYLFAGAQDGPVADWDVGHFVCVVGRIRGPGGNLYAVADTYPSLGVGGVHLQPGERMAKALERPEMTAGGMIVIVSADDAAGVRSGAVALGLLEGAWDNGTLTPEMLR